MDTTDYLMSSPKNRERLLESIRQLREGGNLITKTMAELEAMAESRPDSETSDESTPEEF